jgi:hypothetical protein
MREITPEEQMAFQERMQEKEAASDPNSVYADSLRDEKVRNVIAQLNPDLLIVQIENRIRGNRWNYQTEIWEPISKDAPQISEELVQNFISFLNPYLTQNTSLSNYSADEINNIMAMIIDYIKDDLTDNGERYGLTKKEFITIEKECKLLVPIFNNGILTYSYDKITMPQKVYIGDEITDYNQFTRIGNIICMSVFSVLKQAQNGMLASRIFKALSVRETLDGGQKKSALDVVKFWK